MRAVDVARVFARWSGSSLRSLFNILARTWTRHASSHHGDSAVLAGHNDHAVTSYAAAFAMLRRGTRTRTIAETTTDTGSSWYTAITAPVRDLTIADNYTTGFGQNGDFFRVKLQKLQIHLEATFSDQYPGGISMIFPDGPVELSSDTTISPAGDVNMRAWWKTLDDTSLYPELPSSLASLAELLRSDPVDGIIGFSQGACTAMMLTALCEGTMDRSAALRKQGAPIDLIDPPQAPFKFAIACCGFSGNPEFYSGFYEPKIETPNLHLIANWDTMVAPEQSARLVQACVKPKVVGHKGGHHVPMDKRHLGVISDFIGEACAVESECTSLPLARYLKERCAGREFVAAGEDGAVFMAKNFTLDMRSGMMTPPLSLDSEVSKAPSRNVRWQWKRTRTVCRVRRRIT